MMHPRWNLDALRIFLDVAEMGSVSRTAVHRSLSKSVVSKRLSALEVSLGTSLFVRSAGRLRLTVAGDALATQLRPMLQEMAQLLEEASCHADGVRGTLSVAVPSVLGIRRLGAVLATFAHDHQELSLHVDYDDRVTDMLSGKYDVAIRIGPVQDESLVVRKLWDEQRVVCASPAYVAQHGNPQTLDALAQHQAIRYLNVHPRRIWRFHAGEDVVHVPMLARVMVNNSEAMLEMACHGVGLVLLPAFLAQPALAQGRLVHVAENLRPESTPISVVWPPVRPMPLKLRLFIDHLIESV